MDQAEANHLISDHKNESNLKTKYSQLLYNMWMMSYPNILIFVANNFVITFIYHYLSDYPPIATTAYSIGYTMQNLFSITYIIGMNTAIDTLCSQTFGMKEYRKCCNYFYAGILVCIFFCILSFIPSCFGYSIMKLMQFEEEICSRAAPYLTIGFPFIFFTIIYDAFRRYLAAQKIMNPPFIITTINYSLQLIHSYFFIKAFGDIGAVYSNTLTVICNIVMLIIYVWYTDICKETFFKIDIKEILASLRNYGSKALPGAINFGGELLSYYILNLFSASLGIVHSAVNGLMVNLNLLYYAIPVGFGAGCCTLVGNSLGSNNGQVAFDYAVIGIIINEVLTIIVHFFVLVFKHPVIRFFAQDSTEIQVFESTLLWLIISIIFDNCQGVTNRIFTGMGYQAKASLIILITYFPIMLPMAYFLKNIFGLYGIWMTTTFCYFVISLFELIIIFKTDFVKLALEKQFEQKKNEQPNDKEMLLIN